MERAPSSDRDEVTLRAAMTPVKGATVEVEGAFPPQSPPWPHFLPRLQIQGRNARLDRELGHRRGPDSEPHCPRPPQPPRPILLRAPALPRERGVQS